MKKVTQGIAALAVGVGIVTGVGGTAFAAKAKPATVAQVTEAVGLIVKDQQDVTQAFTGYYLDQMQVGCKNQQAHAAAVKAMGRPKQYSKANWKTLMQGVDSYANGATICVATTQIGIDGKGQGAAVNSQVDAGLKQVKAAWATGNQLVNQAIANANKTAKH